MAITNRKKVIGKLAGKLKSGDTIAKVFENNENKKKKKTKK